MPIDGKLTGEEVLDLAIKEPTLDKLLDATPDETDFPALIKRLRYDRQMFIAAQASKN